MKPQDIIRDPFVLEFTGLPQKKRYKESELEVALKAIWSISYWSLVEVLRL